MTSTGWATTPVTDAALVRLSMNPRVSDRPVSWAAALRALVVAGGAPRLAAVGEQRDPAEPDGVERMAEVMAWHGMARYADPDDLAAYVRSPRPGTPGAAGDVSDVSDPVEPPTR